MIQRRSVVVTAGFAFASRMYQSWNYHLLFGSSSTDALLLLSQAAHPPRTLLHPPRYFSRCKHQTHFKGNALCFERKSWYNPYFYSTQQHSGTFSSSRLFGSKSGSGISGNILIQDDQTALTNIDLNRLQQTAKEIRKHISSSSTSSNEYETYDVSIYLIDDITMQEANNDSRKINKPTDILSFQFHDAISPGKLEEPMLDVSDYYNLGDILIDVPYVIRSCSEDQQDIIQLKSETNTKSSSRKGGEDDEEEEEEEEEDVWVDDDRGVSGAMSKIYDPETRINMLLIHGMLHLVGYDHETDEDYEIMVKKEEDILQILQSNGLLQLPPSSGTVIDK